MKPHARSIHLLSWARANKALLSNASSLIGTTGVTSGLGFAFWWLAARSFVPAEIGLASACISTTMLLGTISVCGLGTLLMGEIPRQGKAAGGLISAVFLVVAAIGFLTGLLFTAITPFLSPALSIIGHNTWLAVLFAVGVAGTTVGLATDQALIGLLRGSLQLWRNALFSTGKLALLVYLIAWSNIEGHLGVAIFVTHILGIWLSLTALLRYVPLHQVKQLRPRWALLRGMGIEAVGHHLLNLTMQVPGLILPVAITSLYSPELNASYYIAWILAGFVFTVPISFATVLYTVGASNPAALASKLRQTLAISAAGVGVANIVCLVGAERIMGLFGASYAADAAWCLRILVLGGFPLIVRTYFLIIARLQKQLYNTLPFVAIGSVLEVGLPLFGASLGGLTGLAIGWAAAVSLEAVMMMPRVYRAASFGSTSYVIPAIAIATADEA